MFVMLIVYQKLIYLLMVAITQSHLWKGRHQHHDYEDNIMIVLTITKITQLKAQLAEVTLNLITEAKIIAYM